MVSILHAARDLGRFRDITTVLVRHGFGETVRRLGFGRGPRRRTAVETSVPELVIEPPSAEEEARGARERAQMSTAVRVRKVLEDLGPSFVKLGQIASTRADLLPAELITELSRLQDSLPPIPFAQIREQVEMSLGVELAELFEHFEETPLAAASIAQVHRAILKTDEGPRETVVKVQRPGISTTIASDLDILHTFASLVERAIPESRIYSPVGLVQQFDHAINAELDFTCEADNLLRFSKNFEEHPQIRFPILYRQACSKQVITLEYLPGSKIHDAVAAGHSGRRLARIALHALIKQIFEDGFFHADPHPGNLLVMGAPEEPVIALIDLGMVGRLSAKMRDQVLDVMISVARRDYEGIADAMYAIGTPTKKINLDAYRAEVSLLAERYLGKQLKDIEVSSLVRDLVQTATKYGIEIPTDFVLVAKALMTLEGIGKQVDPELDIYEETKPLFLDLFRKRYSPERLGNQLLRRIERLSGSTYNLPQRMEEVLDDLRLGQMRIQSEDPALSRSADRLGRRVFAAVVAASMFLSGAWLLTSARYELVGGALIGTGVLTLFGHTVLELYRSFRPKP
ncbi:MAG TPA: AarF/UbiB family protein [Polyangiaceae bacterium]|jgi:ubiquinone biosynthesis protein